MIEFILSSIMGALIVDKPIDDQLVGERRIELSSTLIEELLSQCRDLKSLNPDRRITRCDLSLEKPDQFVTSIDGVEFDIVQIPQEKGLGFNRVEIYVKLNSIALEAHTAVGEDPRHILERGLKSLLRYSNEFRFRYIYQSPK